MTMTSTQDFTRVSLNEEQLMEKLNEARRKFYEESKKKPDRNIEKSIWDSIKKVEALDQILESSKSFQELHPKFVAIQGYFIITALTDLQKLNRGTCVCDTPKYITKCQNLLEPLKSRPEVIWLYTKCFFMYSQMLDCTNSLTLKIIILEKVKTVCQKYYSNTTMKPWDINDIFEYYDIKNERVMYPVKDNHEEQYRRVNEDLLNIAIEHRESKLIFKYGLIGLKASLNKDIDELCTKLLLVAFEFMKRYYFKQANHLISFAMFKAVEYRRSLPISQRTSCDNIQSSISFAYALYGWTILNFCLANLEGNKTSELKEKYQKLESPNGLEVYDDQFPVELVSDKKILKSVIKKSKLWLARAVDLDEKEKCLTDEAESLKSFLNYDKYVLENIAERQIFEDFVKKYDFGSHCCGFMRVHIHKLEK